MPKSIYMFHAIGSGDELHDCDPHYSYSKENFIAFLKDCGSVTSLKEVLVGNKIDAVVTFDDGHISNFEAALGIKETVNGCADFFINPSMVGKTHFMSWADIRQINDLGMSIQSHSLDHVYLSDLNYKQQYEQLLSSKKIIEDNIGSAVTILAPPGGRYNQDTIDICKEIGYQHVSISKPGRWSQGYISPRIAVLNGYPVADLVNCKNTFSPLLYKQVFKYQITGLAKTVLGNKRYDGIRSRLLGAQE